VTWQYLKLLLLPVTLATSAEDASKFAGSCCLLLNFPTGSWCFPPQVTVFQTWSSKGSWKADFQFPSAAFNCLLLLPVAAAADCGIILECTCFFFTCV